MIKFDYLERKYEELFSHYTGIIPGTAYALLHKGQPIISKTTGLANLKQQTPVQTNTQFGIASLTKQFTATCIMILKEQEQLTYQDKIKQYIPELPEIYHQITIQHLLWHTSGLVNYWNLIPDTFIQVTVTNKMVLYELSKHNSLDFSTGENYEYCNTGYILLAILVERISGKPFQQFLRENIFDPMGMVNTRTILDPVENKLNEAKPYDFVDGDFIEYDKGIPTNIIGPGGIFSTLNDLIRWDQALDQNLIVSSESQREAFCKGKLSNGSLVDYGFGWFIDEHMGRVRYWHGGDFRGFKSIYIKYPEEELSFIQLTNRYSVDLDGYSSVKFSDYPVVLDIIGTPLLESIR